MRRAFPITHFLLAVVLQACQLRDAAGPLSRRPSADRLSGKVETVVPDDASIAGVGATQQFDATALNSEGDRAAGNATVHWESSNPAVATVDDNGLATATGVGQTAITARARGITGTATLTVTGAPSRLAFTVQPSDAAGASPIAPAIRVVVQDEFGTTVASASNAVTIAFATNTTGATLSGTTTVTAVHGVATFSDLSVDRPGGGYTLTATAPSLAGATSAAFAVHLTFRAISAGYDHTCAVTTDGAAYCWGSNSTGAVGDGTTSDRTSPVLVAGGLGSVRRALAWVRAHIRAVNAVGGTLVIVMGLLLLSGQLTRLNQLFNFLPLV